MTAITPAIVQHEYFRNFLMVLLIRISVICISGFEHCRMSRI
jgi:hypothetical protein